MIFFLFVDCHTKVHKDHYDKNEEFIGYCKGKSVFCNSVNVYTMN